MMFDKEMVSTASVHSVNNITKWQITQVARTLAITKASCARQLYISERVCAKLLPTFQPKEHAKKTRKPHRNPTKRSVTILLFYRVSRLWRSLIRSKRDAIFHQSLWTVGLWEQHARDVVDQLTLSGLGNRTEIYLSGSGTALLWLLGILHWR